ncbi:MAG: rhodanese-like domain-containing protein [Legionella sp.]|uniref:rhodanese-like domain-containing protein n=1 Tax=Legionella sp. TaxID=459 RepID=UPI0039E41BC4
MEQFSQFITNHWLLWLLFIVILFLTFLNELISQKKKAKELSPQKAVELINNEDAVVIDLREKEAFKNGHIINAINAKSDDFAQQKMEKYKGIPIILVCERGVQSPILASKISTQGYQPMVLNGGINAWQAADLPLVKGK